MKVPKFKPSAIYQMKKLYTKHRDVIEYNAATGNKLEKAIALTIKQDRMRRLYKILYRY